MSAPTESDMPLTAVRRFDDFATVDWVRDRQQERKRTDAVLRRRHLGFRENLLYIYEESQPWLVAFIVGALIGANAAVINIATEWVSDLKSGYCSTGWWLNQKFCCWAIEDSDGTCADWHEWSFVLGLSKANVLFNWIFFVAFSTLMAATCAFLVQFYAPYAAGSGISEIKTILSGFIIRGFMGFRTLFIKSLGLALSVGSGLSVGKEGPSVHVACCVGNVVSHGFSKFRRNKEILTAASAAGVAVAFGSPIGGVLFALEEMSMRFSIRTMWRSFFCALVATVVIHTFNPFRTGKLVMFQVSYNHDWHFFEAFWFMLIGIFGGLYGAALTHFHLKVATYRKLYLKSRGMEEVVALALVTSSICFLNVFLRLEMTELLSLLFKECDEQDYAGICRNEYATWIIWSLLLAVIIRMVLTVVSYGSRVPAGIFVPSMAIGACFGRSVGIILQSLHRLYPSSLLFYGCPLDAQCVTPGTYAFIGAAAALCGATKMTVSLVVIMFELTGALSYILPTMLTVMTTKAVGDYFYAGGIADQLIRLNGLPFLDKEDHLIGVPVSQVMVRDPTALPIRGCSLHALEQLLAENDFRAIPVVESRFSMLFVGAVFRADIIRLIEETRMFIELEEYVECFFMTEGADSMLPTTTRRINFASIVDETMTMIPPATMVDSAMDIYRNLGPRILMVVQDGVLVGLLSRKDVLKSSVSGMRASMSEERRRGLSVTSRPFLANFTLPTWIRHYAQAPEEEYELA